MNDPETDPFGPARMLASERGVTLDLAISSGIADLRLLTVPKALRRQGTGTAVLTLLGTIADQHTITITAGIAPELGTPRAVLERLFTSHRFTPNKGRRRRLDLPWGTTHYRDPIRPELQELIQEYAA